MQDQILQSILTRIDSISTTSAFDNPIPINSSLQPAIELFQILEDTTSTYGDELTEVYHERRAAERDIGLSWQTSYRENIKEGLFSDGDIYYNRAFSTGLRWDLLNSGLYSSNRRVKELEVRKKMLERSLDMAQSNEAYERQYNQIIYTFNQQKAILLQDYSAAANLAFELMQRLHYLELQPWEEVLHIASIKARIDDYKLQTTRLYNEGVSQSAPEFAISLNETDLSGLPLLDLDIERILLINRSGFKDTGISEEDLQKLNYRPLTDVSLSLAADYNIYDGIGRGFNPDDIGGREYFSVGINLSVPLPLNISSKNRMVEARKTRYVNEHQREFNTQQKEILNIYYDYRSKMQLYIDSYKDYLIRQEDIKKQMVFDASGDPGYSIWRLSHAMLQRYDISLELLELKQQIYLLLISFDRYIPNHSVLEFATPVPADNLLPLSITSSGNGVYIWSHTLKNHDTETLVSALADYNIDSVLMSVGIDKEIHEIAKAIIPEFKKAGIETELMIGKNSLIQRENLPENFQYVIELSQKLGTKAVHMDVEPHTFEDWRENREAYEADYLEMLAYAYPLLQGEGISLSVSIPHFYDSILEDIQKNSDNIVVMVYETNRMEAIAHRLDSEHKILNNSLNVALRPVDFQDDDHFRDAMKSLHTLLSINRIYIHDIESLLNAQISGR